MKFSHNHTEHGMKIEYEIPEHSGLDETLEAFTDFLRGCGFNIPYDQYLTYVSDHDDVNEDSKGQEKRESYHDYMGRRLRETGLEPYDPYISGEMLHE